MKASKLSLGSKVRDTVSGWEGIATSKTEWMNGCVRIGVDGADKDGAPKAYTFDVEQIELVEAKKVKRTFTGGDRETISRPSDSSR